MKIKQRNEKTTRNYFEINSKVYRSEDNTTNVKRFKRNLRASSFNMILSRKALDTIILESLILAQDERWRHA